MEKEKIIYSLKDLVNLVEESNNNIFDFHRLGLYPKNLKYFQNVFGH